MTFTASARNAPLMLAVTSWTFDDHPALLAAIVVGMPLGVPSPGCPDMVAAPAGANNVRSM